MLVTPVDVPVDDGHTDVIDGNVAHVILCIYLLCTCCWLYNGVADCGMQGWRIRLEV